MTRTGPCRRVAHCLLAPTRQPRARRQTAAARPDGPGCRAGRVPPAAPARPGRGQASNPVRRPDRRAVAPSACALEVQLALFEPIEITAYPGELLPILLGHPAQPVEIATRRGELPPLGQHGGQERPPRASL